MATRKRSPTQSSRVSGTVDTIFAAAVTRAGKVLPTWPEKGTGRTAPLATCGHCGGKPLIIRRCGLEQPCSGGPKRARFCAVCEKCGAHRAIQPAPGQAVSI
jgi:hypothetical protein